MFYLIMHSRHFILWSSGVRQMVKDHSNTERRNLLTPLHVLLFQSKDSFICIIPQTRQHSVIPVQLWSTGWNMK